MAKILRSTNNNRTCACYGMHRIAWSAWIVQVLMFEMSGTQSTPNQSLSHELDNNRQDLTLDGYFSSGLYWSGSNLYVLERETASVGRERSPDHVSTVQYQSHASLPNPHPTTQDTMAQLKLRLATTGENSIKWTAGQLQQFSSDQITLSSHNTETNEIIFDLTSQTKRCTKRSETSVEHGSTRSIPELSRTLWSKDDDVLDFSLPWQPFFVSTTVSAPFSKDSTGVREPLLKRTSRIMCAL